eukprot:CAMPEP_0198217662 /NCGR_PEP_ID=MMETSP1445-20131203/65094_1 /TAXON_ID=36898 /ORGANISM="Pyramimonas sp., Strain CCMP2087" /LENGTH=273 /DNA_ID=CAMNT_0043894423 /DNA_START=224 /DNA_END=1041 /DNA_ORIENTATION=-
MSSQFFNKISQRETSSSSSVPTSRVRNKTVRSAGVQAPQTRLAHSGIRALATRCFVVSPNLRVTRSRNRTQRSGLVVYAVDDGSMDGFGELDELSELLSAYDTPRNGGRSTSGMAPSQDGIHDFSSEDAELRRLQAQLRDAEAVVDAAQSEVNQLVGDNDAMMQTVRASTQATEAGRVNQLEVEMATLEAMSSLLEEKYARQSSHARNLAKEVINLRGTVLAASEAAERVTAERDEAAKESQERAGAQLEETVLQLRALDLQYQEARATQTDL